MWSCFFLPSFQVKTQTIKITCCVRLTCDHQRDPQCSVSLTRYPQLGRPAHSSARTCELQQVQEEHQASIRRDSRLQNLCYPHSWKLCLGISVLKEFQSLFLVVCVTSHPGLQRRAAAWFLWIIRVKSGLHNWTVSASVLHEQSQHHCIIWFVLKQHYNPTAACWWAWPPHASDLHAESAVHAESDLQRILEFPYCPNWSRSQVHSSSRVSGYSGEASSSSVVTYPTEGMAVVLPLAD